jgi:D-mannonate dehydratase
MQISLINTYNNSTISTISKTILITLIMIINKKLFLMIINFHKSRNFNLEKKKSFAKTKILNIGKVDLKSQKNKMKIEENRKYICQII